MYCMCIILFVFCNYLFFISDNVCTVFCVSGVRVDSVLPPTRALQRRLDNGAVRLCVCQKLPAALQCVASILQDSESRLLRRSVSGRGGPPGGAPCRTSSCDRSSVNSDTLASSLASSLTPSDDVNSLVESLVDSDDDYNDSTEVSRAHRTVTQTCQSTPQ